MGGLSEAFAALRKVLSNLTLAKAATDETAKMDLERGVLEVLEMPQASEHLRMNRSEFATVTGQPLFLCWLADLVECLSPGSHGIASGWPWAVKCLWATSICRPCKT